jgi:RNA polymerase sigma-70 factor (ECF subfamily)
MSATKFYLSQDILPSCCHDQVSQLYSHHQGWLYGWLYKKLGCVHQAEDLCHDTFIKLLKKQIQPNLREPRAYLTTIAHGLVVNHWRRRDIEKIYLDTLTTLPEPEALSLEAHAIVIETLMQIDTALKGLPTAVREAFLLSQLEGLTYKSIAMRLYVSERTIKKYMARAMLHCLLVAQSNA